MLGLSQGELGEALGLTFQQVQKYERGANRVSASRLLELARLLEVPIAFFYDDVDPIYAPSVLPAADGIEGDDSENDLLRQDEAVELVNSYYAIREEQTRRRVFELAKTLWQKDNAPVQIRGRSTTLKQRKP